MGDVFGSKQGKNLYFSSAGKNLSEMSELPPVLIKSAFVVFNDRNKLDSAKKGGDGRSLDSYHMMKLFRNHGFETYYLHNSSKYEFFYWLDRLLAKTCGYFVFFYTGDGCSTKNGLNGIILNESFVSEKQILKHIKENKNPRSRMLHISDSCFNGCILNFSYKFKDAPRNIISISAFNQGNTIKEIKQCNEKEDNEEEEDIVVKDYECNHIEKSGQGVFAYHFRKALSDFPRLTPSDIRSLIIDDLARHGENIYISSTSPELLDECIFY